MDSNDSECSCSGSSSFSLSVNRNAAKNSDYNYSGDHVRNVPIAFDQSKYDVDNILGKKVGRPASGTRYLQSKYINSNQNNGTNEEKNCLQRRDSTQPFGYLKLDTLVRLKDSTRKLLCLLEEIQAKTHSKVSMPDDLHLTEFIKPIPFTDNPISITDTIGCAALKKLENQAKTLEEIYVQDEDDDCSIYKRLTRKCHCLNHCSYNDFIIHFNEDTKYYSTIGEIIKNMRILKKFLYMGGEYAKNALKFLNEGLSESSFTEKVEITQACSYADMCNVFENHSIVIVCISWPCKYECYGDAITQALAAAFLYKLAQLEEGRRYLKFSSKITVDTKRILRKKAAKLDLCVFESLTATLDLLHPPLPQHVNITYYYRPIDKGFGNRTMSALVQYREYMTLDEIFTHLDLLHKLSDNDKGKNELSTFLPAMLSLFKHMLMEYDNSEMNIIVTNILNNIVSKNMIKEKQSELPKTMIIADTATEPIQMKSVLIQIPPKKNNTKKTHKSKQGLGKTPKKFRQLSTCKEGEWESCRLLNRSKKFSGDTTNITITVPIEK